MDTVDYRTHKFEYRPPEGDAAATVHYPVIVVGAGPVGLATAIDLAQNGQAVVLLDGDDGFSDGSRAICFAKRTLEIFDRLGCGEPMMRKGVSWDTGKVFFGAELIYTFGLLPESGHQHPAFVNLQQYYVEGFLLDRADALSGVDVRWCSEVVDVVQEADVVTLTIRTPDGDRRLSCDYLVAADGSRSSLRRLLGHESVGRTFRDRFLIADVRMDPGFPAERRFWFDPPFHPKQSVLLHQQPDGVWRIDFQLGWDADPVAERRPERVIPRIRALLGEGVAFDLEWVSVYTFSCLRMASFRDRRVLFAGDSAHGVSPFGARGANSGVQDADNLAWKLRLVAGGRAPDGLLDSYASERELAADENILNSTRSTDFITPKSEISLVFRNAALELAQDCSFARRIVNSGRLSVPTILSRSPLNTLDEDVFAATMVPGAPCTDAPVLRCGQADWLLRHLGSEFTLLHFTGDVTVPPETLAAMVHLAARSVTVRSVLIRPRGCTPTTVDDGSLVDSEGLVAARFDALPGTTYLLRPDQHVCARWRRFEDGKVLAALTRAIGGH